MAGRRGNPDTDTEEGQADSSWCGASEDMFAGVRNTQAVGSAGRACLWPIDSDAQDQKG